MEQKKKRKKIRNERPNLKKASRNIQIRAWVGVP